MDFYSAIIGLSCVILLVLGVLVKENGRFSVEVKRRFYRTYAVIALSSLAEMIGIFLNGAPELTRIPHVLVKCMDYIFTPYAAVCFARQVSQENKWIKSFRLILCGNVILQLLSCFTGWTFYVDEANYYVHGPYHFLYVGVYVLAVLFVAVEFYLYGRKHTRGNRLSLLAIMGFMCLGIALQQFVDSTLRTACLSMAVGSVMLFIHYSEFSQQVKDESLILHQQLLETDPLTGIPNRYAYNMLLNDLSRQETLDKDTVVFSIDANGLKKANDTIGHHAGDELIRGAGLCLSRVMAPYGHCFRTGGDEFTAVLKLKTEEIPRLLTELETETRAWHGTLVNELSLAVGYAAACDHPDLSMEKLFHVADSAMYAAKEEYYRKTGITRRKSE